MSSKEEKLPIPSLRRLALLRGVRQRCPQCGEQGLFERFARLRRACPTCGLVLRREQGAQTGTMYLTAAISQVFACLLILAAWLLTDWSAGTFIAVAAPIVLIFCFLLLPVAQCFWIAVEYVTDAVNGEDWVQPRP